MNNLAGANNNLFSNALMARCDNNYPPYEFIRDGVAVGYNIDILKAVADEMKLSVVIKPGTWNDVRHDIESGHADILTGMYYSKKRDEKIDFSVPHILVYHSFFVRKDADISLMNIFDHTIIVQNGDIMHDFVKQKGIPTDRIITVENQFEALRLLNDGHHDCALLAKLQAEYNIRKYQFDNIYAIGKPFEPKKYCFAVIEGNAPLQTILNEGLNIIKQNGSYETIYNKWFGICSTSMISSRGYKIISIIFIILSGILLLVFIWNWTLKRQVKLKTQALKDSEFNYQNLVECANSIILRADCAGNILFMNNYALNFFGYHHNEIIGKNAVGTIIPHEDSMGNNLENIAQKIIAHPGQYQNALKNENIRKNGERVWISWTNQVLYGKKGNPSEILCIGNDMTQIRQTEKKMKILQKQLFQAQKMEAIGNLSGGIAHDLNNILGIILGNAELAEDTLPESHPAYESITAITEAGFRARDVIRQLLNFCRKDTGKLQPIDCCAQIKNSLHFIRSIVPKQIDIQVDIQVASGIIQADTAQFHQILTNLILNASSAITDNFGRIIIRVRSYEIHKENENEYPEMSHGQYIQVSVSDNGHGIPSDIIEHIFDPYYTTHIQGDSSGMGLAVVHNIVKKHGGCIRVTSKINEETCFSILFPVIKDKESDESHFLQEAIDSSLQQSSNTSDIPSGNARILIIDDEKDLIQVQKQILQSLGYTVFTASRPSEVITMLQDRDNPVDLLITDYSMPHMNGDQLAMRIRRFQHDLPIIMCTGNKDVIDQSVLDQINLSEIIVKPVRKSALGFSVWKALNLRKKEA
jgi:two-component system sensor histidine kinase EvgS